MKQTNEYAQQLGELYGRIPKAVFAAMAVSALTGGGDHLEQAQARILTEWDALYGSGIVAQKPPKDGQRADLSQAFDNG